MLHALFRPLYLRAQEERKLFFNRLNNASEIFRRQKDEADHLSAPCGMATTLTEIQPKIRCAEKDDKRRELSLVADLSPRSPLIVALSRGQDSKQQRACR